MKKVTLFCASLIAFVIPSMTIYAASTTTITNATSSLQQSIIPSSSTVNSGDIVTLKFGVPMTAVSSKLYLSCPEGIIAQRVGDGNTSLCNVWTAFNSPTVTRIDARMINNGTTSKNVVPNFYIYNADQPHFALGVSSQVTVLPNTSKPPVNWQTVFIHPAGTPTPMEIKKEVCTTVVPVVASWIQNQAQKYRQYFPYNATKCDTDIEMPVSYFQDGPVVTSEGSTFQMPLNPDRVIADLESQPGIQKTQFVTVVLYLQNDVPFTQFTYSSKYNFIFIKGQENNYYPPLTADFFGETLAHEFMHLLGARDKYSFGNVACLNDPISNIPYSGYDIMCHRIAGNGGFVSPPLDRLIVGDATAKEIGWLSSPVKLIRPESNTIVNYGDNVNIALQDGVCSWMKACLKVFFMDQNKTQVLNNIATSFPNSNLTHWVTPIQQSPSYLPPGNYHLGVADKYSTSTIPITIQDSNAPTSSSTPTTQPVTILPWSGPVSIKSGQALAYALNWRGGPLNKSWRAYIQIIKADGSVVFGNWYMPSPDTTKWSGSISNNNTFVIPASVLPGTYRVMAGLYLPASGTLPVRSPSLVPGPGVTKDALNTTINRYQVGTIRVVTSSTTSVWDAVWNWSWFKK